MRIISIEAWKDESGWFWNDWYKIGSISTQDLRKLDTNRKLIKYMRDSHYLSHYSKGRISVNTSDEYNILFENKNTGEPLYAIEIGALEA